jgi:hypothetical protein
MRGVGLTHESHSRDLWVTDPVRQFSAHQIGRLTAYMKKKLMYE